MKFVDIPSYSSILVTACEAEPDMCRTKMDQHVRPPQMQQLRGTIFVRAMAQTDCPFLI